MNCLNMENKRTEMCVCLACAFLFHKNNNKRKEQKQ